MTKYLNTSFDLNSDKLVNLIDDIPFWSAPFGLKLLDKIDYKKNITVLDIGSGTGFPLTEIAMRLGNSCKVYGIDPWATAIKRIQEKIDFYEIRNVEMVNGFAENIPLKNNSINLITSNNGLNNVVNMEKALNECSRLIKKDGQFIQTFNLNNSMFEFYSIMEMVLVDLGMDNEVALIEKQIYEKRKPLEEYLSLLEKYDFQIESVEKDQFDYKFIDGTAMLNHHFIRLAFLDGWKSIVPENRQMEFFTHVEEMMNAQAGNNGFFKMSIPYVTINCYK